MAELKFRSDMDGLGWLYRSAFFLARGDEKEAIVFLNKADKQLDQYLKEDLKTLSKRPGKYLTGEKQRCFWAEKILDEYRRLFMILR
jgi:hypothetical protein